ncbi:MAG: hypothetical protein HC842_04835, partial [Cytophagales bacterium]|nr:hypothetical protein [Cytophagales bacterium]
LDQVETVELLQGTLVLNGSVAISAELELKITETAKGLAPDELQNLKKGMGKSKGINHLLNR